MTRAEAPGATRADRYLLPVLRGAVSVHLVVLAIMYISACADYRDTTLDMSGLALPMRAIVFTSYQPYLFFLTLLALDVLALYVMLSRHGRMRRVAVRGYVIAVAVVGGFHLAAVAIAAALSPIRGAAMTFVTEWWFFRGMLVNVALLATPLPLTLLSEWIRSRGWRRAARGVCPRCAYSLRGLPGAQCPECGYELTGQEKSIVEAHRIAARRDEVSERA